MNESNVFLRTNFLEPGDIHKYLLNKPWLKKSKTENIVSYNYDAFYDVKKLATLIETPKSIKNT